MRTKKQVRLGVESLEGRVMLSADLFSQAPPFEVADGDRVEIGRSTGRVPIDVDLVAEVEHFSQPHRSSATYVDDYWVWADAGLSVDGHVRGRLYSFEAAVFAGASRTDMADSDVVTSGRVDRYQARSEIRISGRGVLNLVIDASASMYELGVHMDQQGSDFDRVQAADADGIFSIRARGRFNVEIVFDSGVLDMRTATTEENRERMTFELTDLYSSVDVTWSGNRVVARGSMDTSLETAYVRNPGLADQESSLLRQAHASWDGRDVGRWRGGFTEIEVESRLIDQEGAIWPVVNCSTGQSCTSYAREYDSGYTMLSEVRVAKSHVRGMVAEATGGVRNEYYPASVANRDMPSTRIVLERDSIDSSRFVGDESVAIGDESLFGEPSDDFRMVLARIVDSVLEENPLLRDS